MSSPERFHWFIMIYQILLLAPNSNRNLVEILTYLIIKFWILRQKLGQSDECPFCDYTIKQNTLKDYV